ncbi:MAG TPA: hypothetical protein VK665_19565, partial [Candidatus Elarobacter sp.]|nr:hypothetical protein [Candidatus Elarobacter sp.]
MRRIATLLLAAASVAAVLPSGARPAAVLAQSAPASPAPFRPLPNVRDAITRHTITVGGRRIAYTARAGSILLKDKDNEPTASMFYVAYTADGASARNRPVTFFWNG